MKTLLSLTALGVSYALPDIRLYVLVAMVIGSLAYRLLARRFGRA